MNDNGINHAERARSLAFLLESAAQVLGTEDAALGTWLVRLKHLAVAGDGTLRVAVAGTVKSGKSTLVNALVGRDVLKRGAGIITSLVTRVRAGPEPAARILLKGWNEVNREVADAALFLGASPEGTAPDLRSGEDRARMAGVLAELGDDAFGEGGFFDKNVALLRAYLDGYERVSPLLEDEPTELVLGPDAFSRHREFAGADALAVYVDDLTLELPGLPFSGDVEIGDCQGYDSPNPRHMEKVQEYLLESHLVLYVVSSRVGLREADLRFLRDIKALGLADTTRFVLNADLGELESAGELVEMGHAVSAQVAALVPAPGPVYTVSALRALLEARARNGEELGRKDRLLLELWAESPAAEVDAYDRFLEWLAAEVDRGRQERLRAVREDAARRAAGALRSRVEAALVLLDRRAEDLSAERAALDEARSRVERTLAGFGEGLRSVAGRLRTDLFAAVDRVFHPPGGVLAEEVIRAVAALEPSADALEPKDRKRIDRQMSRIYQEMKTAFHQYKVEEVNPRAVEQIRRIWAETTEALGKAARGPADLLVASVEGYRAEAARYGVAVPPLDLPDLDPSIGRRVIPLFSSVAYAPADHTVDRALAFASQWTRKLATGWTRRLLGRAERKGFVASLLEDGVAAVRELLDEEVRSNLLNYNEQLKYQVLGPGLEALVDAWADAYRETVEALVLDLGALSERLEREGSGQADLEPRLRGILDALEPLS